MPVLSWISDDNLSKAVGQLLATAQTAKIDALKKIEENVMDPVSAIFQMAGFGMTYEEWFKSEEARQAQKTMQNFVGEFHQEILGCCNGWINKRTGNIIDLISPERNIVAEIKNKHNTISGGALSNLYHSLEELVMPKNSTYKGFTAYHVSIIPKNPKRYNIDFTPADKSTGVKCPPNELIRTIDGASFYALVTGDKNALNDLYNVLPDVIGNLNAEQMAGIKNLQGLFKKAYG